MREAGVNVGFCVLESYRNGNAQSCLIHCRKGAGGGASQLLDDNFLNDINNRNKHNVPFKINLITRNYKIEMVYTFRVHCIAA